MAAGRGACRVIDRHYRRLSADGDYQVFESTEGTASNWDATIQHGSPALALMTKAIEELAGKGSGGQERSDPGQKSGLRVGRLILDILGAIPVAPVRVRAWVERPGTRISLVAAEMLAARPDGTQRTVARVSAWLLATSDTADAATDRFPPLVETHGTPNAHDWAGRPGYLETVSWRAQPSAPGEAAVAWLSPLVHLVDDEPLTDLQRLAMVVDSANGVGAALDPNQFVFMNTDTAVHLHRAPRGNDFALRARGSIGPDGIGVTTAEIFDRDGFIGTSAQTLLVQRT
jgi:Acyl-CoA thioesterase C-terminal domain/Acyl-CoA thioesterase N-terminal domain